MNRAAALAWKGRKKVEANPMVGAVFVKQGKKIAEGYHRQWGGLHAETEAVRTAQAGGQSLKGSTVYVTLEPCCHHGKQGPCTDALIQAGVAEVVYAQKDPNPLVAGQGLQQLQKAGISVRALSTWETLDLNALYLKNSAQGLPFVHIKTACTREEKITAQVGTETPLGGPESMKRVHEWRNRYDGILVGVNTVLIDNPRLTARRPRATHPVRFILDTHLKTPPHAQMFAQPGKTVLVTAATSPPSHVYPGDTEIWEIPPNHQGKIPLEKFLQKAYAHGVRSLLVEGGEAVNTSFLKQGLVDRLTIIVTPHTLSPATDLTRLPSVFDLSQTGPLEFTHSRIERVGQDLWSDGFTKPQK